jgi:hypothetical protein
MKKTLLPFFALGAIISVALAEESTIASSKPIKLAESQMDNINAGFHIGGLPHVHQATAVNLQLQVLKGYASKENLIQIVDRPLPWQSNSILALR